MRRRYRFRGMVQGVGFRYHTSMAARSLGVTGWVRNDYDGSVEMEAQADAGVLDMLVSTINRGMYIEIDDMEVIEIPEKEEEREFRVRML